MLNFVTVALWLMSTLICDFYEMFLLCVQENIHIAKAQVKQMQSCDIKNYWSVMGNMTQSC